MLVCMLGITKSHPPNAKVGCLGGSGLLRKGGSGQRFGSEESEECATYFFVSVICVGWAGFWADSRRQIPTSAKANNGISYSPPMVYTVFCRNTTCYLNA